jgi:Cu/Ag efflux protein CusF
MAGGKGAGGHDMGAMKDMPGKTMSGMSKPAGGEAMSKEGHDGMGMGKADDSAGKSRPSRVTGTGVVQGIDKANGKVKLTHEPIAALGWPRMTMFFRLQASSLAEKVKEGDAVNFSLEKSASGYVISSLEKSSAPPETKKMK